MGESSDLAARPVFRRLSLGLAAFCAAFALGCLIFGDTGPARLAGFAVGGWLAYVFFSGWRTGRLPGPRPPDP